jgi:phosphopantothenate-cysteine ligase/phosphopantothenoylcysteine decarboxylase/phosphopantothenate--cysteine ligase
MVRADRGPFRVVPGLFMRVLVTAGNTQVPIDRVRCLTNIFSGRTGAALAACAHDRGHDVTLLTSHPEALRDIAAQRPLSGEDWRPYRYSTFADLESLLSNELRRGGYDAVIHCAAVSDYLAAGVFAPAPGTGFDPQSLSWSGEPPRLEDRAAGKVKSDEPELWLRLVRAPKLIDKMRSEWSFSGVLVKFKLEVGTDEPRLLEIAERSRRHSHADLMVANTLEGAHAWAYLGPLAEGYERISRRELPVRLLEAVEAKLTEKRHG